MIRTTDPEVGARELSLKPTLTCEECDTLYWDEEVSENLKGIGRGNSPSAIDDAVRGSKCPECGHTQDP